MNAGFVIRASDFAAVFLLIYGLKRMASPATARSGIIVAGVAMLVATLVSFLYALQVPETVATHLSINTLIAAIALVAGMSWAWWSGRTVAITAMPQMVALYNGMGGGAAAAIAAAELVASGQRASTALGVTVLGALIGTASLAGSLVAWAKLDGRITRPWRFRGQRFCNAALLIIALAFGAALVASGAAAAAVIAPFFLAALAFGVALTLPIGGADMPVVISLFNAFTGLSVGLEGFVVGNPAIMIAGMVVGSAGTLLTLRMARAMNRSVANVLLGNFGDATSDSRGKIKGNLKPADAADAAISMRYAAKLIIIPGYGLAAAQAQQRLYDFVKLLQAAGVDVKFAIHPVAGRMPGHMDVLLAEAGVPYDLILDLDEANAELPATDVALVIGANDVVNPAARTEKSSPIYGMPILNADRARQVYVVKRGQGRGYSGVDNELFYAENCNMVYGDAQAVLAAMIQAVRELEPQDGLPKAA